MIQKKWVVEVVEDRSFQTPRGTVQHASRVTYKISDLGIDHLEGASMYQRPDIGTRVNISTVRGVTVVGDGNVVNTTFAPATIALDELRQAILSSTLPDERKLEASADIDTLQAQLQKPNPDREIIKKAWSSIQTVVTLGELTDLLGKVGALIGPLLA